MNQIQVAEGHSKTLYYVPHAGHVVKFNSHVPTKQTGTQLQRYHIDRSFLLGSDLYTTPTQRIYWRRTRGVWAMAGKSNQTIGELASGYVQGSKA